MAARNMSPPALSEGRTASASDSGSGAEGAVHVDLALSLHRPLVFGVDRPQRAGPRRHIRRLRRDARWHRVQVLHHPLHRAGPCARLGAPHAAAHRADGLVEGRIVLLVPHLLLRLVGHASRACDQGELLQGGVDTHLEGLQSPRETLHRELATAVGLLDTVAHDRHIVLCHAHEFPQLHDLRVRRIVLAQAVLVALLDQEIHIVAADTHLLQIGLSRALRQPLLRVVRLLARKDRLLPHLLRPLRAQDIAPNGTALLDAEACPGHELLEHDVVGRHSRVWAK
mmetsp:Transcript_124393/g.277988  ORF Transcript_124393/g.277988 Transcript_124393/m.277988 type:complete len:283 (+) Transcript_124393:45-893(+)